MPPALAAVVFAVGILMLFRLDRAAKPDVSPALWIPTVWLLIAGSRMLSEWQVGSGIESPDQYFEGSPLDRLVLTGLLAAGCGRARRAGRATPKDSSQRNWPLLLFFAYCGVSVLWSDYPGVAFKRWTKALGDVVMVMVVLTDPDPFAAVKRLFARTAFMLIPLSVLLVKYYPELGRGYDRWTWTPYYGGRGDRKERSRLRLPGLRARHRSGGFWGRSRGEERDGSDGRGSRTAWSSLMTLWLFWKADSATSLACFFLGGALLAITSVPGMARTGRTAAFPHGRHCLSRLHRSRARCRHRSRRSDGKGHDADRPHRALGRSSSA